MSKLNKEKVTVQELITPVPATSGGEQTGPQSSRSSDRKKTISEVGNLASVVGNASRREEKEESGPGEGVSQSPPSVTEEASDPSNSSDDAEITILAKTKVSSDEVNKMVEDVSASIAKLTTRRKRLSGAQRRKAAKLKKKLDPSTKYKVQQDAPKVKGTATLPSLEGGKRFRSPEEQKADEETAKKRKGSLLTRDGTYGRPILSKRGPTGNRNEKTDEQKVTISGGVAVTANSSGASGSSVKKVQQPLKRKLDAKPAKEQPSFAKVARKRALEDLCYAVIDSSNPTGKIPEAHRAKVEETLNERVMQYTLEAGDTAIKIQVESCRFTREVLMLQLASEACVEILRDLVGGIATPWEGGKLTMVRKSEIPSLTKSSFFIKGWGSKMKDDAILDVIGKQNEGLAVKNWEVFHRAEGAEGTLFVVGIDKGSMAHLVKTKGKAFFVTTAIYFKIGKTPIGWESGPPEEKKCEASGEELEPNERGESEMTNSQEDRLLEDK